jgi:SAM-dependent methyltransferase
MADFHVERIRPTKGNLEAYLNAYHDHRQRYEFALQFVKGRNVADIACGAGYGTYMMAQQAAKVTGYDVSDEALEHARENFAVHNTEFRQAGEIADARHEVIISFETLEHMDEVEGDAFLRMLHGALTPGGMLVISTPNCKSETRHNVTPYHKREYSCIEFPEKLRKNGFHVVEIYGQGSRLLNTRVMGLCLLSLFKKGLHRIIPKSIRRLILSAGGSEMILTKDNWQDQAVQLAVCRRIE